MGSIETLFIELSDRSNIRTEDINELVTLDFEIEASSKLENLGHQYFPLVSCRFQY